VTASRNVEFDLHGDVTLTVVEVKMDVKLKPVIEDVWGAETTTHTSTPTPQPTATLKPIPTLKPAPKKLPDQPVM